MKKTLVIFICLYAVSALAQLSPGKLQKSHADLEGLENCSKCHEFKKKINPQNCLECHTILADRIKAGKGLHANPDYKACEKCHVEHQGRDYDLIYWPDGKEQFKHDATGYTLQGKHAELVCEQCHQAKNIKEQQRFIAQKKDLDHTMLGLDTACLSCHQDEHRAQLGGTCLDCHTMEGWKPATKFNHNNARYTLTGRHQNVDCAKCHPQVDDPQTPSDPTYNRYKGLNFANCTPCHQDVHNNRFGPNCESCHNTSGWASVNRQQFDHAKTPFPLKGKHAAVNCEQCHLPGRPLKIQKYDRCIDCHRDYHAGQFTRADDIANCEKCHTENGFTPSTFTIRQHNELDFHLEGSHMAVPCIACHKKSNTGTPSESMQFRFASTNCITCHPDPHSGQVAKYTDLAGCQACHSVASWRQISFDHNQTKFPLVGKHQSTTCANCHVTEDSTSEQKHYAFLNVSTDCQSCHQDTHLGQFREKQKKNGQNYTNCARCHTPANWIAEKFDHNRDASFKLQGAHEFVDCNKCHVELTLKGHSFRLYKPLRSDCKFCHGPGNKERETSEN